MTFRTVVRAGFLVSVVVGLVAIGATPAEAQSLRPNILFIFDTSGSMAENAMGMNVGEGTNTCPSATCTTMNGVTTCTDGKTSRIYNLKSSLRSALAQVGSDEANFGLGVHFALPPLRSGAVAPPRNPAQVAVPFFLVILLIMIVLVGSAPHLGAVAEDKMQRVFEMLLISASPFELMMGKVLAALGTSLTSSIFYVLGGLAVLAGMAMFGIAPVHLLPWFFAYLIAEVLMISALSVALGSACGTPQDAQQLAFLLFLPIMIPMFVLTPVLQQPNGVFATVMSFIPPFTPVLMLLRQALPGGVPWWQPWLGLIGVSVCAAAVVWAAARIFRIGILSQGKVPKLSELAQWVARG